MKAELHDTQPGQSSPSAPLRRALGQSQQVHDKVEQAATDLGAVNAVLKAEVAEGPPLGKVERALDQSEAVEVKVQEAAAELVSVNRALSKEIGERHLLEERLSQTDSALARSQSDEETARQRALHDALTGLPNLTLFTDRVQNALAQTLRHGWRLAVLFIDLDGFKSVNDTHGHAAGDRLLQVLAQRLETSVRGGDTVSRRSGDEFLLLMLEVKNDSDVAALATKIMAKLAEPCDLDDGPGSQISVQASIGIALYPQDGSSPEELLEKADLAMYAAKQTKTGPAFYGKIAPR